MKVVHIGHAPLPPSHPDFERLLSHPGSWVVNLCKAQAALPGLTVELVTHVPGGSAYFRDDSRGFPIHYIPGPDRFRAASLFFFDVRRLSRFVRKLQPDVVHAHGTEESYALAAQAVDRPSVITAQGCFFIINREFPPKWLSRARVVEMTERVAFKHANNVIAKSAYIARELQKKFPHLRIHEIPNTFDPHLLEIAAEKFRSPFSVAFVGTVVERKGVDLLVDAIEVLATKKPQVAQHMTLHVFGNRPTNPSDYEKTVLTRLSTMLGRRLTLHGVIPSFDVAKELMRIELLVAPSREEMFGNQLIEALLMGCRAVVTEGTALAENLSRFQGGSVARQNDANSLADAIVTELKENHEGEKNRVKDAIISVMGPQVVAQKHYTLYASIVSTDK